MLVELQSLVVGGATSMLSELVGVDSHRAHLMIAILDKFFQLKLTTKDIFILFGWWFKTQLPDIDLSIASLYGPLIF